MPVPYPAFFVGQLPAGGTIRTKDTEYGKEHDLYPRQNFAAVDFVCAAGAVCPVFAGYVRRGGPVDCGQVCSIGGCFGGLHRLADHDDADKPGQQLCHGHHDFAGPADRLRRKEERRPHGWHSNCYVCCDYAGHDGGAGAVCTADQQHHERPGGGF